MTPGLAALLVGLSVFLIFYAIFAPRRTVPNLGEGESNRDPNDSISRYIRPMLRNFLPQTPLNAVLSQKTKDKIQELLIRSGNPWGIRPEEFLGIQILFAALGFFGGLILTVFDLVPFIPPIIFVFVLPIVGYLIPFSIHNSKREARVKEVQKQLPEALDLLVITLASGQNFEPALGEIVPRLPEGLLKVELGRITQELRAGRTMEDSLLSFARRASSDEVEAFAKSVVQAQQLGADVSETLENQAAAARQAYEGRLDKKIARLSTLMFMPLIVTMLPALLIIFLGPTTSTLGAAFGR